MGRPLLVVLAFVAVVTPGPTRADKPRSPDRREACSYRFHGREARTLVANRRGRVARTPIGGGRTFGCLYSVGKIIWLGDGFELTVDRLRLRGPFVGYEYALIGRTGLTNSVRVIDLRTRRLKYEVTAGSLTADGDGRNVPDAGVVELKLKTNGSVGWIYRNPFTVPPRLEVWKRDSTGQERLDFGPGIDAASLTLSGSTLSWMSFGALRSATLE